MFIVQTFHFFKAADDGDREVILRISFARFATLHEHFWSRKKQRPVAKDAKAPGFTTRKIKTVPIPLLRLPDLQ
jgi:hypothetical protein